MRRVRVLSLYGGIAALLLAGAATAAYYGVGGIAIPGFTADPEAPMPSPLLKPGEGWLAMSVVVTREGQVRDVMLLPGDS